ncbi:hypothetical protein BHE74_00012972 [Ensete ventricosum]|nr:hypothetical protein BHE74_00012972 [Ensete ventricosum]
MEVCRIFVSCLSIFSYSVGPKRFSSLLLNCIHVGTPWVYSYQFISLNCIAFKVDDSDVHHGILRCLDDAIGGSKIGRVLVVWEKKNDKDDAIGNSPEVRRKLTEGIGGLSGCRKEVCQKKTETHRKIIGGSRNDCQELGRS